MKTCFNYISQDYMVLVFVDYVDYPISVCFYSKLHCATTSYSTCPFLLTIVQLVGSYVTKHK